MADHFDPDPLRTLCEQASKESDSQKLLELTGKIAQLLEQKASPPPQERAKSA
jgi:hypothetical protein